MSKRGRQKPLLRSRLPLRMAIMTSRASRRRKQRRGVSVSQLDAKIRAMWLEDVKMGEPSDIFWRAYYAHLTKIAREFSNTPGKKRVSKSFMREVTEAIRRAPKEDRQKFGVFPPKFTQSRFVGKKSAVVHPLRAPPPAEKITSSFEK